MTMATGTSHNEEGLPSRSIFAPTLQREQRNGAMILLFTGFSLSLIMFAVIELKPTKTKLLTMVSPSSSSYFSSGTNDVGIVLENTAARTINNSVTRTSTNHEDESIAANTGYDDNGLRVDKNQTFSTNSIGDNSFSFNCSEINRIIFENVEINNLSNDPEQQDYDDSQNSQKEINSKPYLIYHIGPPKTGTTTIQDTLHEFSNNGTFSTVDKYIFFSNTEKRKLNPLEPLISDDACHDTLEAIEKDISNNNDTSNEHLFIEKMRAVPCWRNLIQRHLNVHRKNETNILWSRELLSEEYSDSVSRFHRIAKLLEPEWNVMVIIAYRRLFEHSWSSKTNREHWTRAKPRLNRWEKPLVPEPFYPKFARSSPTSSGVLIRLWTLDTFSPFSFSPLLFRLANFHHSRGILYSFVCKALPNAHTSCQRLINEEQQDNSFVRLSNPADEFFYYDVLTVMASKQEEFSNITRHLKRRNVVLKAFDYNTNMLNQTWHDFPVICPSQEQMTDFLNRSLKEELWVYPHLADNEFCLQLQEKEHREKFWSYYDKQKYCWIDHETVLNQPEWVSFFTKLANGDNAQ